MLEANEALRVIPPDGLRSPGLSPPALTLSKTGELSVFMALPKASVGCATLMSMSTGGETNVAIDELVDALKAVTSWGAPRAGVRFQRR